MKKLLLIPVLALSLLATHAQKLIFVKQGANGSGTSWASPLGDLQTALKKANAGDQIWVAAGTYLTTTDGDRNISFVIPNEVALYGGFAGHETSVAMRNWALNKTILSGEIGSPSEDDNAFTVVYTHHVNARTIVDGFEITNGKANGSVPAGDPQRSGAGWFNDGSEGESNPTISNCQFVDNQAREGAGLYNYAESGICKPVIKNCQFLDNSSDLFGGGIYNNGSNGICTPKIQNCLFSRNESRYGAGITNSGVNGQTRSVIINTAFTNNVSFVKGSGIFSDSKENSICEAVLQGCRFSGNVSSLGDGEDVIGSVSNNATAERPSSTLTFSTYR